MLKYPDTGKTLGLNYQYSNTGSAPIATADAKAWGRIDYSDDDSLISDLIDEVISVTEKEYNFTIIDKTVTATWESYGAEVRLPLGPVKSVTSIKRTDNEGTETTLTTDDYRLIGNKLLFNKVYPYEDPSLRMTLEVVYTTGWDSLPNGILLGLKKAILSNYEDRQDNAGGMTIVELPNASKKQFQTYRRF